MNCSVGGCQSFGLRDMAIIIEGKTLCGICGLAIVNAADATCFPAFLPQGHRLSRFSDSAFHKDCFVACPERQQVDDVYGKYRRIWNSRPQGLNSLAEIEAWGREAFDDL